MGSAEHTEDWQIPPFSPCPHCPALPLKALREQSSPKCLKGGSLWLPRPSVVDLCYLEEHLRDQASAILVMVAVMTHSGCGVFLLEWAHTLFTEKFVSNSKHSDNLASDSMEPIKGWKKPHQDSSMRSLGKQWEDFRVSRLSPLWILELPILIRVIV